MQRITPQNYPRHHVMTPLVPDSVRLCANCKHYRVEQPEPICKRFYYIDLVTGDILFDAARTQRHQKEPSACGVSGYYYEGLTLSDTIGK